MILFELIALKQMLELLGAQNNRKSLNSASTKKDKLIKRKNIDVYIFFQLKIIKSSNLEHTINFLNFIICKYLIYSIELLLLQEQII